MVHALTRVARSSLPQYNLALLTASLPKGFPHYTKPPSSYHFDHLKYAELQSALRTVCKITAKWKIFFDDAEAICKDPVTGELNHKRAVILNRKRKLSRPEIFYRNVAELQHVLPHLVGVIYSNRSKFSMAEQKLIDDILKTYDHLKEIGAFFADASSSVGMEAERLLYVYERVSKRGYPDMAMNVLGQAVGELAKLLHFLKDEPKDKIHAVWLPLFERLSDLSSGVDFPDKQSLIQWVFAHVGALAVENDPSLAECTWGLEEAFADIARLEAALRLVRNNILKRVRMTGSAPAARIDILA